jgi:hypothetical protein
MVHQVQGMEVFFVEKGKDSLQTPAELLTVGEKTGLNGNELAYCSRLSAKVDNTAVQDGFQLCLHSFVVDAKGHWAVVQQGMNTGGNAATARRYHWHSGFLQSFVEEPHAAVCGVPQGAILNLVAKEARPTQAALLEIVGQHPEQILSQVRHLAMPTPKEIKAVDVDLKRLGAMLYVAQEQGPKNFEEVLLLKGMAPRTLQSLALVSEVIHGTPSRFSDPARFSFAHGGKGRRPYAVPTKVYDQTIQTLRTSVERAKLGLSDKQQALKKLSHMAQAAEQDFSPHADGQAGLDQLIRKEQRGSWRYGGRSMYGTEPSAGSTEP